MCGRFLLSDFFSLIMRFNINLPGGIKPRYNIAPSQEVLAIIDKEGYEAVYFRWGLIPSWSRGGFPGLINARAETVAQKPSFKHSFKTRRCLIPANGFYEWKKEGDKKKPYIIFLKNKDVFTFAGLWDTWETPKGETIASCTIITTTANALLEPIHNRMPVILSQETERIWLSQDTDFPTLQGLLKPYPAELMESYAVSTLVNDPRNDTPEDLNPAL